MNANIYEIVAGLRSLAALCLDEAADLEAGRTQTIATFDMKAKLADISDLVDELEVSA